MSKAAKWKESREPSFFRNGLRWHAIPSSYIWWEAIYSQSRDQHKDQWINNASDWIKRLMLQRVKGQPASVIVRCCCNYIPLLHWWKLKIRQHVYFLLLRQKLVSWVKKSFERGGVFLHQGRDTYNPVKFVSRNIAGFWSKKLGPFFCRLDRYEIRNFENIV